MTTAIASDTPTAPSTASTGLLDEGLRCALGIGVVLVLLWPPARGYSEALGWLPLWLLGMPLAALWAVRGCPLPRPHVGDAKAFERRRRRMPQARRRTRTLPRRVASRAA